MDAAHIVGMAAERAGADLYAPGTWDGDDASSFAMVRRSDPRVVVTVNADDLIYVLTEGNVWGDLYAYAYMAEHDVTDARGVLATMVRAEDGASLDPTGDGIVSVNGGESAEQIADRIVAALDMAAESARRYEREHGHGSTVATLAIAGAAATWLATGYGPAILGF